MNIIITLLIALSMCSAVAASEASSIYEQFDVKYGILKTDETWSGKVLLIGDVKVPKMKKLTLQPGTWLVFANTDYQNLGEDPGRPELLIDGSLHRPEGASVEVMDVFDSRVSPLFSKAIESSSHLVSPKPVETTEIRSQLRRFKIQYFIGYAAVYSLLLVFL